MTKRHFHCIVDGCESYTKTNPDLSFFSLPRNEIVYRNWVTNLNLLHILNKTIPARSNYRVCQRHFVDRCFQLPNKKKLNYEATPTLINGESRMNMDKVCRTCLIVSKDMKPLFERSSTEIDKTLAELFMLFTPLKCSTNDGLPNQICNNCISELSRFHTFQSKCIKSDTILRNNITNTTPDAKQHKHPQNNNKPQSNELKTTINPPTHTQNTQTLPEKDDILLKQNIQVAIRDYKPYHAVNKALNSKTQNNSINQDAIGATSDYEPCRVVNKGETESLGGNMILKRTMGDYEPYRVNRITNKPELILINNEIEVNRLETQVELDLDSKKRLKLELTPGNCTKNDLKPTNQPDDVTNTLNSPLRSQTRPDTEITYSCPVCDACFKHISGLTHHMRSHTAEKPYACRVCGHSFKQNSNLIVHERMHTEKPYACSMCDSVFDRKDNLNRHEREHSGEKPYACSVCSGSFTEKSHLNVHMRTHSDDALYPCTNCDSTFNRKDTLSRHMRQHNGEKPYACSVCTSVFSRKEHLTPHIRIHTGAKPYACTVCEAVFKFRENLAQHMQTHTGEKPCAECDRVFGRKEKLTVHMRTHTGEKPYACAECKCAFKRKDFLTRHMLKHTGENLRVDKH